jgi:biopolymer transport protein ExbB/TolQ
MKKLSRYYYYVGIPIAVVAIGVVAFFGAIMGTVDGNPHPQINYLIFMIIPLGMIMMGSQVHRMNRELKVIETFYKQAKNVSSAEEAHAKIVVNERVDSAAILQLVKETIGRAISSVQHSAVEAELDRFDHMQARRLNLPNFLGGLMVGLGLLGTFIGLLGALSEIGKLIGSFSSVTNADPSVAIRGLVENLTAPMKAMGVAFSASLFGVLGSLIMGVLLVGVKNCSAELTSILRSRVAMLADFGTGDVNSKNMNLLNEALMKIAEQSPVMASLIHSLAQSEHRATDLIDSMFQLSTKVELQDARMQALLKHMDASQEADTAVKQSVGSLVRTLPVITDGLADHFKNSKIIYDSVDSLREAMRDYLETFHANVDRMEHQQERREIIQQTMMETIKLEMQEMLEAQKKHYDEADESRKALSSETQTTMKMMQANHHDSTIKNSQWQGAIGLQLVEALGGISKHMQVQSEAMTMSNNRLELALLKQNKI